MSTNSIFTQNLVTAPQVLNIKQQSQILKSKLISDARKTYMMLCKIQKSGINKIFNHPTLTPQEAADALGTSAAKIFLAHRAITGAIILAATLDEVTPDILDLPPFTVNIDGTVTIGEESNIAVE